MLRGSLSKSPEELPIRLGDWRVVDAGNAPPHQSPFVELPKFIPIGTKPVAGIVVPLIGETDCHSVLAEPPKLLDQAVIELARPLAPQKSDDLIAALDELGTVPPSAIGRVSKRNPIR